MIVDLHNHTKLCNHATGEIDEYVDIAIQCGTNIFGFSDHAPMKYDEYYRMKFDEMRKYEQDVLNAKERFKDKIDIKLGYEVDYLPDFIDKRVLDAKVDYFIGSVHFINKWGFDNPAFIGEYNNYDINELWETYFSCIKDMAESQLFDIVGHFDLLKVFNFLPTVDIVKLATPALEAIKKSGMALEMNAAGLRKKANEQYPSTNLLQKVFELEIPITFGSDAHEPTQVGFKQKELIELAKNIGFSEAVYFENRKMQVIKI